MEYIVYLTINTKNKKIYVGVHGINSNIFDGYIGNGIYIDKPNTYKHSKTIFQRAVNKYGPDSFKRITLKTFKNEQEAYNFEKQIVDSDFLNRKDVYNMALGGIGGDRGHMAKTIYQYDINGFFVNEYKSCAEASRETKICYSSIKSAKKGNWPTGGFYWLDYKIDKINFDEYKIANTEKIVYQYNNLGEYECKYKSVSEAGLNNNSTSSLISRSIKSGYMVNNKYFSFENKKNYSIAKSEYIKNLPVHQYSLSGEYIKSFNNKAEAVKEIKIKNLNIGAAIKLNHSAGGFQWSYEQLDKMNDISNKNYYKPRKVGQYDMKGVLVKIYDSVSKCKKDFSSCDHVLSGARKQCKGYTFKYED